MRFEPYPFEKLTDLLKDTIPNPALEPIALTIGEPQFETPIFIQEALQNSANLLKKYPKTAGETYLKQALHDFCKKRFDVTLKPGELIPTFGTREVLFNFPQFFLFDKPNPLIAYTNPFYQIYEGAAIASRARRLHINLEASNHFAPYLSDAELKDVDLVILNFPNNPTTATLNIEELGWWVKKALEFDFVVMNDECYSEIYHDEPTRSLLEASIHVGNESFKNVLVINSISKRSSAPGLRSGFIAGDATILKQYAKYRTYTGTASPLPLQVAAAAAWSDEEHVEKNREKYRKNFEIAKEILGIEPPKATFYVWLPVDDDLEFTKSLYEKEHVSVLPGSFLGRDGMGDAYVRIALVEEAKKTRAALLRLRDFMKNRKPI
ncbi:succinyldiaminopimelate transaminase [Sulfurospirillum sp. 1612]|uniref:succinyldiaminopimelate transaminase n=1 Tax=Sulfurospirillum sp. 1612 TaxID=3094835 RepID=UPI002F9324A7